MKSTTTRTLLLVAGLLARRASSLDLRLDIAGGNCNDVDEFDDTFNDGVIPATEEVMDITTTTQHEETDRIFGFSVFRGGEKNVTDSSEPDTNRTGTSTAPRHQNDRDLLFLDCPVFSECPGAGDPYHWCTWICGYWDILDTPRRRSDRQSADGEGGLRMLRRVTQDLRIPDEEVRPLLDLEEHRLEPISYTHEDRELMIGIENLVCGWIQRWLDSPFSRCLNGAQLFICELDLRSQ